MSREYYDDYRHGASRKRRKSLPGNRVQRGDADPFGRDGCGHDRNAAGTVRAPGANLDFSGAGVGRSGGLCNHPAGDVVLDHSVAVAHCPSACRTVAGGPFQVPLFLKPELRRHYGEETSFGRGDHPADFQCSQFL